MTCQTDVSQRQEDWHQMVEHLLLVDLWILKLDQFERQVNTWSESLEITNQLRETEESECKDQVEKIVQGKETHQTMEISLEFLSVEHNNRETIPYQSKGTNYQLKQIILHIIKRQDSYQEKSFNDKTEDLSHPSPWCGVMCNVQW